jgi:hypothetical protein
VSAPASGFVAWLGAALAAVALAGCSAAKIGYEHADTLLHWQATRYVDLQGKASDDLARRIDVFLAWHRTKALPQYIKIANDGARRIERGLSAEDVNWGYDAFMSQARESLRAAAEQVAPLLDQLNAEQVLQIERRFAEDNRKFERESLRGTEKDRRKRRAKRTAGRLEDWVGRLSKGQMERVRLYSERAPLYDDLRDHDRRRLQADFLGVVRAHEAAKRFPELAANFERGRNPAYGAAIEANRKEYTALLLDLDHSLTPEQRARAAGRLRSYAVDFGALAAEHRASR